MIATQANPVTIERDEPQRRDAAVEGVHLVSDHALGVLRQRMAPGAADTAHRHCLASQYFYVLSGVLVVELDGVRCVVAAGQGVHVSHGVTHRLANESAENTELLVVSAPNCRPAGDASGIALQ